MLTGQTSNETKLVYEGFNTYVSYGGLQYKKFSNNTESSLNPLSGLLVQVLTSFVFFFLKEEKQSCFIDAFYQTYCSLHLVVDGLMRHISFA